MVLNIQHLHGLFYVFRLTFEDVLCKHNKDKEEDSPPVKKAIVVEPHVIPSRGPYLFNEPKK